MGVWAKISVPVNLVKEVAELSSAHIFLFSTFCTYNQQAGRFAPFVVGEDSSQKMKVVHLASPGTVNSLRTY